MLPFLQPPPPPPENVEQPLRILEGHQQQITGLVYTAGKLYSSSYDLMIKVHMRHTPEISAFARLHRSGM
jgi:hypothetical protein